MGRYIISVGHTATNNLGCGAVGYLNESNCTREIAPLIVDKLRLLGHTVTLLQVDEYINGTKDYYTRVSQANSIGGDLFVEIHLNSGGGTGCEVLTTNGSDASNVASNISRAISSSLNITNRGHKTTNGLFVLNHTYMPSCLVECCFVDSQKDYSVYNADKIATAIVNGITGQTANTDIRKLGWNRNSTGWWYCTNTSERYYYNADNGWKQIDGKWYIFDSQGYAYQSNWIQTNGYWYWLKDDCSMARNEWIEHNGNCYYLGDQGGCYLNCITPDGYTVDKDGAWISSIPKQ